VYFREDNKRAHRDFNLMVETGGLSVIPCSCEATALLDLNHRGRGGRRGKIAYHSSDAVFSVDGTEF